MPTSMSDVRRWVASNLDLFPEASRLRLSTGAVVEENTDARVTLLKMLLSLLPPSDESPGQGPVEKAKAEVARVAADRDAANAEVTAIDGPDGHAARENATQKGRLHRGSNPGPLRDKERS